MARIRRKFTPEFKAEAVKLFPEQGYSFALAAANLGINENSLQQWKKALNEKGSAAFPGHGRRDALEKELARLREDNQPAPGTGHCKKVDGLLLRQGLVVRYALIDEHRERWPVRRMCQLLQVSPAGFYTWSGRRRRNARTKRDAWLVEIPAIHREFKGRYGSLRIHVELLARGHAVSRDTVAALMKRHQIRAKTTRKFRHTTDSNHAMPVGANRLDRQFDPDQPNRCWSAAITDIPTGRDGCTLPSWRACPSVRS